MRRSASIGPRIAEALILVISTVDPFHSVHSAAYTYRTKWEGIEGGYANRR